MNERLSKIMARRGLCSRREADRYIESGWVFVDGVCVDRLGVKVSEDADIRLAPNGRARQAALATILFNKPVGIVSGQPEKDYRPAVACIGPASRWAGDSCRRRFCPAHLKGLQPAGRLDIDSTGLLVLTQDGRVARRLIGKDTKVEKEYLVRVTGSLSDQGLERLKHGLSLDGRPLEPAEVAWQNRDQLRFVLREGKKRQIRRMCEAVGLNVIGLKRVRIGNVRLGRLPVGQWRYLSEGESF